MWTIFKAFIEFVTILLLFYVLVFWPQVMWNLTSPTGDQTHLPCVGRQSLNYWITREVPHVQYLTVCNVHVKCYCSVAKSCPTLCKPMDTSKPVSPLLHHLPERAQTHVHWVSDANHLILCCPLLLLPSVFPSVRVFSNESALHTRWPKYWNFSFSISPSTK